MAAALWVAAAVCFLVEFLNYLLLVLDPVPAVVELLLQMLLLPDPLLVAVVSTHLLVVFLQSPAQQKL